MNAATERLMATLSPQEAARALAATHAGERGWLDEFAAQLDHYRAGQSLGRTLAAWGVSQSEAARMFGVSRQAVSKWLNAGVPTERSRAVANLAAATDLLVRYLKRERIPAVVRRPAAATGNRSLLDLWAAGETTELLEVCRAMFDFDRAQS